MDSVHASWQFGSRSELEEQDLDFEVVSSSDDGVEYGLLEGVDEALLRELVAEQGSKGGAFVPLSRPLPFDQGFVLAVRAIQHLRNLKRKGNKVIVGIGGSSGSGKSSLAHKIASVVGCAVVSLENYIDASKVEDENYDTFNSLDKALLTANLEDILNNQDTELPLFDLRKRERIGFRCLKAMDSSVVVLEGAFALHGEFSKYLDLKLSIVGGVHYNLVKRVLRDLKKAGRNATEQSIMEDVYSSYKEHVEPHLTEPHIVVNNDFDHLASLRKPLYILRSRGEPSQEAMQSLVDSKEFTHTTGKWIDTHLKPPGATKLKDWLRIRQSGSLYTMSFCEWIVEGDFIISPRATFDVGVKTLGSLLALGYEIGRSIKRSTDIFTSDQVTICIDAIEELQEAFISIKGANRQAVLSTAQILGLGEANFETKSILQLCLQGQQEELEAKSTEKPGVEKPQLSLPMRLMQAAAATLSSGASQPPFDGGRGSDRALSPPLYHTGKHVELVPIPRELSFDQGLLLAVRGVQKLREHRMNQATGSSNSSKVVIVGIGGPSGSGKSRLAQSMAELLNCDVLEMENYYDYSRIYDDNFDEVESLDMNLLRSHLETIRRGENVSIPEFDLSQKRRTGYRSFAAASGIVLVEGVYALQKKVRPFLDFRIAVVGGVHFNLVKRVHRDAELSGRSYSQTEILDTIFPLFRQHIEPGLRHAHLRIRNHFDPLTSLLTPQYVLKSKMAPSESEIADIQHRLKLTWKPTRKDVYNDIYLVFGPKHGDRKDDWIRVRQCGGRYTILFRESLREGDLIIQPPLDFEVGVKTLAGLICLGYQMVALVEATATHFISADLHISLEDIPPLRKKYVQLKSSSKNVVKMAADALNLKPGGFTTKTFIDLIRETSGHHSITSFSHGTRTPSATELKDFLARIAELNCESPDHLSPPSLVAARRTCEISEIKAELQRLNRLLTVTASFTGAFLIPVVGIALSYCFTPSGNKRAHNSS
eukprot:CAMPEP_0198235596 /NCGR_PEP_ID=MMETSP1446-20131203/1485_1 /TAXON_ID=1461542 ORGANISM="Unidentified sp, Strain CCMP2111" /NCGR_SAMPLE_ID=MMETSP1446 /ASSEMBLY_ACC=CAM_ASM_001112 /LENGTH=990 /DNA_ID=CAMNT_0043916867 /DNA_START=184 /DNA_END=3156 /DNA_ORIENTATION=-